MITLDDASDESDESDDIEFAVDGEDPRGKEYTGGDKFVSQTRCSDFSSHSSDETEEDDLL